MKSAYRSVMFYVGQKELEMQCKMNRLMTQCRQKCEALQEKFSERNGADAYCIPENGQEVPIDGTRD